MSFEAAYLGKVVHKMRVFSNEIQSGFSIYSLIDLSRVMKTVVVMMLVMMEMNWLKWLSVSLVEPRVGSGVFFSFQM